LSSRLADRLARATASDDADDTKKGALQNLVGAITTRVKPPVTMRRTVGGPDLVAFIVGGAAVIVGMLVWASGARVFKSGRSYQAIIEFPRACGITVGTPVRIRGVRVGQAVAVRPSLEKVEVVVEVDDEATVIPRRSEVQANQSGLIAEPLIDVVPTLPIAPFSALPTHTGCEAEGVLVCNRGRIQGEPGVALDDLVYIMTKLANQMDMDGYSKALSTAEAAQAAILEARPLLQHAAALTREILPLVRELRDSALVKNVESLSATTAAAANDIHKLSRDVLTPENVAALRDSVVTLTETLKHFESISADMGKVTSDRQVQASVRQLVEALSRLVSE